MNRHVIKGRGANRGMYLCYGKGGGYAWSPKQSKAARWSNPRYDDETYAKRIAREHDGYWVELVAPAAIVARVNALRKFITEHADAPETRDCYWIHGSSERFPESIGCDSATSFCHGCCAKKVEEIHHRFPKEAEHYGVSVDGGFGVESDHTESCETCGVKLECTLTDYGADEEIAALTGECAPTFDDGRGWDELHNAIVNLSLKDPRWRWIARVVDAAKQNEGATGVRP